MVGLPVLRAVQPDFILVRLLVPPEAMAQDGAHHLRDGRKVWTLILTGGAYLDLSVIGPE